MRLDRDLSQNDIAEMVGVSGATVSRWESDVAEPQNAAILGRLAEVLGVTRSYLAFGEGPKAAAEPIPPEYLVTNHEGGRDGMEVARELEARREAERKAAAAKRRKRGA